MKNLILAIACLAMPLCNYAQPADTIIKMHSESCCTQDCCESYQTPAGIMIDHIHPKGKWMVNYTYMDMLMQGNRIGTHKVSDNDIFNNYAAAPEKMAMQMHMLMVMYGVTDRLTLMAMCGYAVNTMKMNMDQAGMQMMMNMPGMSMDNATTMNSRSTGFTDTKVSALYNFIKSGRSRLIGSIGINMPTGPVTLAGTTLAGDNQRMPYSMQIGAGSLGVLPSVTYVYQHGNLSLGGAVNAGINTKNNQGYRLGNIYNATAWGSYRLLPFMSASLRAEGVTTGKIGGYDPQIAILMNNDPTANADNYGGQRVNAYIGLNFKLPSISGLYLLTEYGMPLYQNLNGPQMSVSSVFQIGLQYML